MTFTQERKRRAVSPMPNLHSQAAVLSYVASYSWTIPKPALIKNYAKVLAITKEILFLDMTSMNNSIAGLKSTISRLSVLDQASHSTSKVSLMNQLKIRNHWIVWCSKLSLPCSHRRYYLLFVRASIFKHLLLILFISFYILLFIDSVLPIVND